MIRTGVLKIRGQISQKFIYERKHNMARKKKAAKRKRTIKGLWSKSDLNLLKKLFPNNPTAKIATQLGRRTDAVKKKASRMRLRKSRKYLKSLGRA
jgi:hypothetical protein